MRVEEWFAGRIPERWGARAIEVLSDTDEILVIVDLDGRRAGAGETSTATPRAASAAASTAASRAASTAASRAASASAAAKTAALWRDATRDERMAIAEAAELTFGTKVSWGVRQGHEVVLFTTATVPVMTRLRLPERRVLDTLIDGGLARTRSEALAWCVRLVGEHEEEWLGELRAAFQAVEEVRRKGPRSRRR